MRITAMLLSLTISIPGPCLHGYRVITFDETRAERSGCGQVPVLVLVLKYNFVST